MQMRRQGIRMLGLAAIATTIAVGGCGSNVGEQAQEDSTNQPSQVEPASQTIGDDFSSPPVIASWSGELGGRFARTGTGFIAQIENTRQETVVAEVSVFGMGLDQREATTQLGRYTLGPGERRRVHVPLDSIPVQSVGAPSEIMLFVTASGATWSDKKDASVSAYIQFSPDFKTAYGSVVDGWAPRVLGLVDGDTDDPRVGAISDPRILNGTQSILPMKTEALRRELVLPVQHPIGRWRDDHQQWMAPDKNPAVGGTYAEPDLPIQALGMEVRSLGGEIPGSGSPLGSNERKVCAKWSGYFRDAGMGEDFLATGSRIQIQPARYAKVEVVQEGGNVVFNGWADVDGCVAPSDLPEGQYTLKLTSRLRRQLLVGEPVTFSIHPQENSTPPTFSTAFSVTDSEPTPVTVTTFTSNHYTRTSMVAGHMLWRPSMGFVPASDYDVRIQSNDDCNDKCATGGKSICFGNFFKGGHSTGSKFVIAHEIGHGIMAFAVGLPKQDYSYTSEDYNSCACAHVETSNKVHCLQSLEHQGAAIGEGFVEFVAARAFNDLDADPDCTFVYNKEFRDDFTISVPPIARTCSMPVRWARTRCGNDIAGKGVEWDWLAFFAKAGRSMTTKEMLAVQKVACGNEPCGDDDVLNWQMLSAAASEYFGPTSQKALAYDAALEEHGVKN